MTGETLPVKVREEFLVKKYEGDPPQFEGEKEPIEVRRIVAENGVIISSEILSKNGTD